MLILKNPSGQYRLLCVESKCAAAVGKRGQHGGVHVGSSCSFPNGCGQYGFLHVVSFHPAEYVSGNSEGLWKFGLTDLNGTNFLIGSEKCL